MKPEPTRTFAPLHFEDLDPHRFEDLVRQLAYGFRSWSVLEAIGRSGDDGGVDIRGIEADRIEAEGDDDHSDHTPQTWLFQVKRESKFGPAKARQVAASAVFDEDAPPSGFVLAVAADLSRKTRAVLVEDLRARGVSQVLAWGRGELEDMLFDPKRDHLLFAYFGISLQVRRRGLVSDLRQRLAKKRQIFNALGGLDNQHKVSVLLRDPLVDGYPFRDRVEDWDEDRPPWITTAFERHTNPDMVALVYRRFPAWVSADRKSYDAVEACSHLISPWEDEDGEHDVEMCRRIRCFHSTAVPDGERAWLEYVGGIPVDEVLLVDDLGDAFFDPPHLAVTRDHAHGFFTHLKTILTIEQRPSSLSPPEGVLDAADLKRLRLFPDDLPAVPPSSGW